MPSLQIKPLTPERVVIIDSILDMYEHKQINPEEAANEIREEITEEV